MAAGTAEGAMPSVWPIRPAIELQASPLDLIHQGDMANRAVSGEINHPRQEEVTR
jgi:hypothetical protein